MKQCSICFYFKDITEFKKRSSSKKDGRDSQCKECYNSRQRDLYNGYEYEDSLIIEDGIILGKVCKQCFQLDLLENFYIDNRYIDGYKPFCVFCYVKICNTCNMEKSLIDFYDDSRFSDGKYRNCKSCHHSFTVDWQKSNPIQTSIIDSRSKYKRRENIRIYNIQYRLENREYFKDKWQEWYLQNYERAKQKSRNRRAMERQVGGTISTEDWLNLVNEFNSCCAYCGKYDKNITQDHIIPISRGGSNTIENILPACWLCNCKKNDKTAEEFYESMKEPV